MVSCQKSYPLKGSKHFLQCHPHDAALVNAHFFVSMGVEARCCPCHRPAHFRHIKRQPSLHNCCPCHGRCHCNRRCPCRLRLRLRLCLCCRCRLRHCCRCPSPLLPLLPSSIVIAVAVSHCCCGHHPPLPPPSLLHCRQPLLSPSPLLSAIAVSVTIGHRSCHLRRPLPLPSPSAIAKRCCLGTARIVFKQFKQIMLTLFYFAWKVGSALIKAR
jgi:hypothetical protein